MHGSRLAQRLRRPRSVPAHRQAELSGERGQLLVGARERRAAQEDQRRQRHAGEVGRLVAARGRSRPLPCGNDRDLGHRLVDGQTCSTLP
jgi:hypothetical protein